MAQHGGGVTGRAKSTGAAGAAGATTTQPHLKSLYEICVQAAVNDCVTMCKFCKKEFRFLPNNVLFDFYYTMCVDKRLCLLAVEFSELEIVNRMLTVKHKRVKLLKSFQALIEHGSNVPDELVQEYTKLLATAPSEYNVKLGLRIGSFLNEGSWYTHAIRLLSVAEQMCKKLPDCPDTWKLCIECYHKRIYAETIFCDFKSALHTFNSAQDMVKKLEKANSVPNLAGLYSNFSNLYFHRSEYDESFAWAKKALALLNDQVPTRIVIEVLRQTSRACVVKRRFTQAGLLIRQAVNLAKDICKNEIQTYFSDTLLDYGFYLLNYDSVHESVNIYERSLHIRKQIFDRNNLHVALAYEDLAYALYVKEYSSGRFYMARETAERAISLLKRILPEDHLLLSSAKRVKALILEEIALDMREGNNSELQKQFLMEAEELHRAALDLSKKAFGKKNVQTAKHYGNLGRLYQSMKLYDEAEMMHLKAIAIKEEILGKDDYEVGLSIGHLASLYNYHMKRHQDAEKLYKRSMEINLNLFGETYSGFEYDYRGLIHVYSKLGDDENVILYNLKMKEWKVRRSNIKTVPLAEEILPLDEIVNGFLSLC